MSLDLNFLICKMGSNNILALLQGLTHAKHLTHAEKPLVLGNVQGNVGCFFPPICEGKGLS